MKVNFRPTVSVVAAAMLALMSSGCASVGPLARQQATLPKDQVDARALFVENCSRCHGLDGRARTFHGTMLSAEDLTSNIWQLDTSDDMIVDAINNGPGAMPAFGKKLSTTEIEALAEYVRTLKIGM